MDRVTSAPPRVRWLPVALAWVGLAVLFVPQTLLLQGPGPPSWWPVLRNAQIFLLWALLTPLVLRAVAAYPPFGPGRAARILRHVGIGAAFVAAHVALMVVTALPFADAPLPRIAAGVAIGVAATNVLIYGGIVAAGAALEIERRRRAAAAGLARARLDALQAQLHPHLLFNTLNALAELVHADATRAEAAVLKLAALMRRALTLAPVDDVALSEELAFAADYLDLQRLLLGDRLRVAVDVQDAARAARVPPLILQPLVENAVRHGVARRADGGTVAIVARRDGEALVVDVGNELPASATAEGHGVGLANVRERLAAAYGADASVTVEPRDGRMHARLALPWNAA